MADSTIAWLTSWTPTTDDLLVFYDNADWVTKKAPISSLPSGGSGDMLKANYDPANINQQVVGTTATQTLSNKTLTAPRFADLGFIADSNGNEMLAFNSNTSAVNYIELENSATGTAVNVRVKGDDANIGLKFVAKGSTGYVNIADSTDETKIVRFDPSTNTTGVTTTVRTNSTTARTIDLPNATDTLVGRTTTDTLTNKSLISTTNVISENTTIATSTTPTPTGGSLRNYFTVTALATNPTFSAPSGTPVDGSMLIVRIKDNGTARTLAWNAIYRGGDTTLPTTTILSKTLYLLFIYNSADARWDLISKDDNH